MLSIIANLPDHVLGIHASGEVTKNDIESVLIPALDDLVSRTGRIHYLLQLDTDVQNWDFGAWVSDAKAGIRHLSKWTKIAVVTEQSAVRTFTDIFSKLAPGEARGFTHAQLDEARAWVSATAA